MEILADYHTHTVYSHGKGSIEDNVKVAISKGIKKIGISDHGYKNVAYGVKIDDFEKMREEIDILNEKYKNQIEILLGVECNILDNKGNIDLNDKIYRYHLPKLLFFIETSTVSFSIKICFRSIYLNRRKGTKTIFIMFTTTYFTN